MQRFPPRPFEVEALGDVPGDPRPELHQSHRAGVAHGATSERAFLGHDRSHEQRIDGRFDRLLVDHIGERVEPVLVGPAPMLANDGEDRFPVLDADGDGPRLVGPVGRKNPGRFSGADPVAAERTDEKHGGHREPCFTTASGSTCNSHDPTPRLGCPRATSVPGRGFVESKPDA